MLDPSTLDELRALAGPGALREAQQQNDVKALAHTAHSLRGSCAIIGARRMTELAARLEDMARERAGDDGIAELLDRLHGEFANTRSALEAETAPGRMNDATAVRALLGFVQTGELPRPDGAAQASCLVEAARAQGLAALLDDALLRSEATWPPEASRVLRQAHRAAAFRGEQLCDLLRRARALLATGGIRTLPLKGMALVGFAYDSPAERPMDDVDLLLLDGWEEALARLEAAGFQVRDCADHAWALHDPASRATLELHRGLATCPEMFPIDAGALWSRRAGPPGEERPSAEDLLVQLSVHAAFQHGLRLRLIQFLDFRRVLERAAIDVVRLVEIARAARAEGSLLAALEAASALVAAPVAEPLLAELRRLAPRRLLRRVKALRQDPSGLLVDAPAPRTLAAWRLAVVGSRRFELVARTLLPSRPDRRESALERLRRGGRRGVELARLLRRFASD